MEDELRKGKISGYTINNDNYAHMYNAIKIALPHVHDDLMPNSMRIML